MANWCKTDYVLTGSKRSLRAIRRAVDAAFKETDNGWSPTLRDVLRQLGFSSEAVSAARGEKRGYLNDYAYVPERDELMLHCNTAWDHAGGFENLLRGLFPDIDIRYVSVEPGMDVYATNRPELKGLYLVTVVGDAQGDTFEEKESIPGILKTWTGLDVSEFDEEAEERLRQYNIGAPSEKRVHVRPLRYDGD